ncbi:phage protein [Xylella fastidiosa]|uniref:phage protein n=1 Tax=Xylella fastidiosa TaxID=2371 RepID=UPI0009835F49|nr:hypothetical protein [Xylella fastidiosa]ALR08552.2 hypothetical protein XFFB_04095 [Xylella fastidiosa]AWG45255.1 hypothetical protein XFFB_05205 [Xylella fastidiosa]WGZ35152.1 hypothetical protein O4445_04525 [Xylella fastidiosa subsp. pauca]WGZ35358.1 hypothetical protein O4445_05690 [Xylella fastidiosa subsp. pauca]WGZ37426.1 hypothetical protein O4443_04520 [Xylella fastidiosa subsp. pauca]
MKQFGRQYRLEIGSAQEGIAIDTLRIAFDIRKTSDSTPNPAKITVWNLNRDHLSLLTSRQYNRVRLLAGYAELRLLFVGDIIKPSVRRDGTDYVIELECGDGDHDYRNAHVSFSLAAGATDAQVLSALSTSMPSTRLGPIQMQGQRGLSRGKVLSGNTRDLLDALAKNHGADWSIQDGALMLLPADTVLAGDAVLLSQSSGMMGSPEVTDDGLKITTLLNPALRIGGLVRVDSIIPIYNGDYKITSLHDMGDVMAEAWFSTVTCVGGDFQNVRPSV